MKIADIIKYEGDNQTFIWKHPAEDFNTTTQLIVHESQEAVFFLNGQALDLFGPGRHTLTTQNIPLLGRVLNQATGGETPFHCEVYFINKTVQMSVKWGTDSKVRFMEPKLGIPLEIGACGEMNLQVADSRKLLVKLVGTTKGIAWGENGVGFTKSLQNSFRPLISTAVKSHLSTAIKGNDIDIIEIDEHLETLSDVLRQSILPGFEEYGLTIPQFYITTVLLPENDPNFRRLKDLHTVALQTRMAEAETMVRTAEAESEAAITAARRQVELERQATVTEVAKQEAERELIRAHAEAEAAKMAGFAEAEVMQAKGYTQRDVLQAEVQMAYAEGIGNMGSGSGGGAGGGIVSDMVGIGVGMAAAGNISSQMSNLFAGVGNAPAAESPAAGSAPAAPAATPALTCAKCGTPLPENAKFCLSCGEKVTPPVPAGMVVCPDCGKTVPVGKFCLECGHAFVTTCPNCAAEVPAGAKFCLQCGQKL